MNHANARDEWPLELALPMLLLGAAYTVGLLALNLWLIAS